MKNAFLFIVCVVSNFICVSQKPDSVTLDKISIKLYHSPVEHIDSVFGAEVKSITYFVHGNLVLKREESPRVDSAKSQTRGTNVIVTTTKKNPVYLIDLNKKTIYTYCKDAVGNYLAFDSLKNHFDDIFYKAAVVDTLRDKFRLVKSKQESGITVAGYRTFNAEAAANPSGIISFKYSAKRLPVKSPLNSLYPEFPEDILSICFPSNPNKGQQMCFTILEIKSICMARKFFDVPNGLIRMNVPASKIRQDLRDPFIH